jgi:hypothetical protein
MNPLRYSHGLNDTRMNQSRSGTKQQRRSNGDSLLLASIEDYDTFFRESNPSLSQMVLFMRGR